MQKILQISTLTKVPGKDWLPVTPDNFGSFYIGNNETHIITKMENQTINSIPVWQKIINPENPESSANILSYNWTPVFETGSCLTSRISVLLTVYISLLYL